MCLWIRDRLSVGFLGLRGVGGLRRVVISLSSGVGEVVPPYGAQQREGLSQGTMSLYTHDCH